MSDGDPDGDGDERHECPAAGCGEAFKIAGYVYQHYATAHAGTNGDDAEVVADE